MGWHEVWRENYPSAIVNQAALAEEIQKEVTEGRVRETSVREARREYGDRLAIASLALIQEGPDKWRIVHDGTNGVRVNTRIRPRDQGDFPTVIDMKAILEEMSEEKDTLGTTFFTMTWDFMKAHRIVHVDRKDWGLQACCAS